MKKLLLILFSISAVCTMNSTLAFSRYSNSYMQRDPPARKSGGMPARINTQERVFIFSPHIHRWGAYDAGGNLVLSGVGNGGSNFCPDLGRRCHSPVGTYRIMSKEGAGCISSLFPIVRRHGEVISRGGAHMPYCMYFHGGFAIHGYAHLTNANVSHGCIRIPTPDAQWLSYNFMRIGTKVRILGY